jgi:sec-independent protein translocase protein TatB
MFGMGWPEIGLILVVALLLFGPEKLPELARQAGGFVRTVRQMADNAKNLDPREIVRRNFLDDDTTPAATKETRILRPGERPPFDSEAT